MSNLLQTLTTTISRVMADMFFMFPDEEPGPLPPTGSGYELALRRVGSGDIRFYFHFHPGLGVAMTENFVGISPDQITPEMTEGTLQEFVNMVVGNLLNQIDADLSLGMGIPQSVDARPEWVTGEPSVRLFFESQALDAWFMES